MGKVCRGCPPGAVLDVLVYQPRRTAVNARGAAMTSDWQDLVREVRRGRLVVYPTETFYALGCMATLHASVERVVAVKARPGDKPLPLIIADWAMAERFLHLDENTLELARRFWPGPLSIVMQVDPSISPLARDGAGRSAVRMTPHPVAARLCLDAGAPLVSSSANVSGAPPACRPMDLDQDLLSVSGALLVDDEPWPAGGLPSTLVESVGKGAVRVLRAGAVSIGELQGSGVDVVRE